MRCRDAKGVNLVTLKEDGSIGYGGKPKSEVDRFFCHSSGI